MIAVRNHSPRLTHDSPAQGAFRGADQNRTGVAVVTTEWSVRSPDCPTCDGDGYLDDVDDWGGVVGAKPCPDCAVSSVGGDDA